MKRLLLVVAVIALYTLHQDIWFWRTACPLVFGFLPIGLFYHACFSAAAALLMWLLVKHSWPSHLEADAERPGTGGHTAGGATPESAASPPSGIHFREGGTR